MKKLLLLLLTVMMGISSLTLSAQNTLTVANGTTTNSNVPIHGLWADAYLRCQTIYTAGTLDAAAVGFGMNGGTITSLTYYLSSAASDVWTGTWEVKMMEVTDAALTGFVDMTDATTVYTGALDGTSSPLTITLTTPYDYEGGNLLIEVSETAKGNYKSCSFYGVTSAGSSWQGYNSTAWASITGSAQNFIPKTTFTFTGGTEITCSPVQNLVVNEAQTTSSSLTLVWADSINEGATYSIYDLSDNTLIAANIADTTYTIENLAANTEYTFGVEVNCSATDASAVITVSGRTACGAIVALPWEEGFEDLPSGSYQLPFCWSRYMSETTSTTAYPYSYNSNAHSGSRSLYYYGTTGDAYPDTMVAILPELDVNLYPMSGNRLVFWAKMGTASNSKNLYVGTMANPTDPTTFTLVDSVLVSGNVYTKFSVPMTNATGAYIALVVFKGTGSMYIDDVTLEEMPSCLEISNLTVTGTTSNSISLAWTDNINNGATYSIYNMSDSSLLASDIAELTYTVENLDANTLYTFGVEANCSSTDASPITMVSGRTDCDVFSAPYTWTFEDMDASAEPLCWTKIGTGTVNVLNSTTNSHDGSKYVRFSGSTSNLIALPETQEEINTLQVRFWTRPESYTNTNCGNFSVGYMTDVTADSSFVEVANYVYSDFSAYAEKTVTFAGAPAGARMAMRHNAGTTSWYWYIDDVTIEEAPDCLPVSALAAIDITAEEATLTWTGDAASYNIYDMSDTSFVASVSTTTYDLTGLTAMTNYTYGVAADCNGDESPIVSVTFNTACSALELPYTETFETTSSTLDCWTTEGNGNWTFGTGDYSTSTGAYEGSQNAKITHGTTGNVTKLISPVLENAESGLALDFAYVLRSWSGDIDELRVYARTDADSAWQMYGEYTDATSVWTTETLIIPGTVYQVAFEYTDNYGYGLGIDSVVFTAMSDAYCYPVADLTVEDVTSSTVSLSWSDENNSGATYTIYDMADNTVIASGVSGTTYDVTGLTATTGYTFGVVANCSANDASNVVTVSVVTACEGVSCTITIVGADSYGDGWNNHAINVMQSGNVIGTFTLVNGSSLTETFTVCGGSPVTFSGVSGSYPGEVSFEIHDGGGITVYSGVGSDLTPGTVFFTLNDACPSCLPVTDLTVDTIFDGNITISWTGSAASYDVYNGDTFVANVTANTYTFSGLAPSTNYTFGVQAICSATDSAALVTISASTDCGTITTYPYAQDFSTAPACWMIFDADGDGQNWILYQGTIQSASYNQGVLTPDNWLISPQFAIPATGSYEVTWTATAQDQSWPAEHYGVFVSTTDYSDTANFTMLQEWTLGTGIFNPVIDLSGYAGQNIYIALRHFNCTDQFRLSIDDFIVREQAGANQVTINAGPNNPAYGTVVGAGIYNIGDNVTLTANPSSGYTFSKWVDETNTILSTDNPYTFVAATDLTLTAIFLNDAGTTYTITVDVNDSTMGTATGGGTYTAGDQITLTATPFSGYNFVNWTQVSGFGTNVVGTEPTLIITVTGDKTFVANFENGSGPVITDPTVATVAASAIAQTSATLNANITNPDNVTITAKGFEWKATAGGTYTQVTGTGTGNTFTANLSGLTANTGYTYKAFITFEGTTVYGEEMTFTTLPEDVQPCNVPANLHTTVIQSEVISIAWDADANVTSWNIQYRPVGGALVTATSNTNSYTITGLTGLTTYEIQVQANCGDGNLSDWTAAITAQTTGCDGIENYLINRIALYPNPAKEYVDIRVDENINVTSMEVYDVYGKLINTVNVVENPTRINVSALANGMYFVRVTTEEGTVTKSFVKK